MSVYKSETGNWSDQPVPSKYDTLENVHSHVQYHSTKTNKLVGTGFMSQVNLGKAGANWYVVMDVGDEFNRTTVLQSKADVAYSVAGAGNAAYNMPVYTFPQKILKIDSASLKVGLQAAADITATPSIALGSAAATGAVAVLTGTATFIDIIANSAMADTNGTVKTSTGAPDLLGTASTVAYLNIAAAWSAADTLTLTSGSQIIIHWKPLDSTPCLIRDLTI